MHPCKFETKIEKIMHKVAWNETYVIWYWTHCMQTTVEPPNRGHFGTVAFVLSSEVVLFSEVVYYLPCIPPPV